MKFREWEDFADEINEYGRHGYIKKKSMYNPFTKVNTMVMEHKVRDEEVEFVLYPDDESYDLDWVNDPYVRPKSRFEKFVDELPKRHYDDEKIDRRTKEHRSDKYPEKPGTKKDNPDKQNLPPKSGKTTPPKPKPGPYQKKEPGK